MRVTRQLVKVALALLASPFDQHWGYDLKRQTQLPSGTLYPILDRLLERGWLEDGWEDPREVKGRPPRRYYRLTNEGRAELGSVAETASRRQPGWAVL